MHLLTLRVVAVVLVAIISVAARAADAPAAPIDWDRARTLYQSEQRGEKLSPEDQAYLDRAKAARQQANARPQTGQPQGAMATKPAISGREFTDLVPLTQLTTQYKGFDGGLYGNGSNQPPQAQMALAQSAAASITPLDVAGGKSPDGRIVLMSIGMSNTTQEFSCFKQIADADPQKSASLLIVDAAQSGKDAAAWTADTPNTGRFRNPVWDEADRRLAAAGVSPKQVQVVWLKQALIGPARLGEFPDHAKALQSQIETILLLAHNHYPNLRLAYLSSRIYAGYAQTQLNPEPYAYESAFAVRWTIEDQVKGDARLNANPAAGDVKAPVLLWGPYLWTNGTKGRASDDVVFQPEDLGPDGTHPSPSGQLKVANMLLAFFKSDATAKPWFLKASDASTGGPAAAPAAEAGKFQLETALDARATQSADGDATRIDIQKASVDIRGVQIYLSHPGLRAGSYRLIFMAKADKPRTLGILAAEQRKPSRPLTSVASAPVDTDWQRFNLRFQIESPSGDLRAPVIQFGDATGTVWVRNCTIQLDGPH